jgi:hypothetical protein
MKKSILSLLTIGLFATTTFVGCKSNTDEATPAPAFSITSGDATITVGQNTTIAGSVSAANNVKLKTFTMTTQVNGVDFKVQDTTFAKSTTSYQFSQPVSGSNAGVFTYKLTASDDGGRVSSKTITITVNAVATLNSYTANLLGDASNATAGSFFATSNGTVYKQSDAKANSGLIDFVYFNSTLAAPSNTDAKNAYSNSNTGIQTWSTINTTYMTSSTLDFATATVADITTATNSVTTTELASLNVGTVGVFKTGGSSPKVGIFKVTALTTTPASSASITIDVKVQK